MKITLLILLSITVSSCSTFKVSFKDRAIYNEKKKVEEDGFSIHRELFLWGLIPKNHELDVSEFLKEKGIKEVKGFSVYRESKLEDVIWSILSLGVYTPQTYRLKIRVE